MKYHFLMVNRGRYLCPDHGGFCDSSDNYSLCCPLCRDGDGINWGVNKIDRALQILGNLQKRSQRAVAIVSGLIGILGVANILKPRTLGGLSISRDGETNTLIVFCFLLFLLSVVAFALSMSHMNVTTKNDATSGSHAFETMELVGWEEKIVTFIRSAEGFCSLGKSLFSSGAILLLVAFVWYEFGTDVWYEWQYNRMKQ